MQPTAAVLSSDTLLSENAILRAQLDAANKSLQDLVYVVSHDLGSPLRAVTSFSGILQNKYKDSFDSKSLSYLNIIAENSGRAQMMLAGLLVYSRVHTQTATPVITDFADIVGRALSGLASKIIASGAVVKVDRLPELAVDANQVDMLFRAAIDNALTYRDATVAPHIEIQAREFDGYWKFFIADNGIGIPHDQVERVFHIFKRLHSEETYPGIGMGLSIARRIVQRHGGEIGLMPSPSGGSICWFTLPKPTASAASGNQTQEEAHA